MDKKRLEWMTTEYEMPIKPNLKHNSLFRNKKLVIPIFLALISTLIQFIFLRSCAYFKNAESNENLAVVVTNKNLKQGDILSEENTKLVYMNLGSSRSQFILNSEFKNYIGSKIKLSLSENTPILKTIALTDLKNLSLPEKIPKGKRFYTIEIDSTSLSSILQVGDLVDIMAHMDINGFGKATETILNRIKIIGIGNSFEEHDSNENANTLSFYLTPEEVKIISFMKSYSQFTVALRNPNDSDLSENTPITFNKFIQNEKIQRIVQNDGFKIIEGKSIK